MKRCKHCNNSITTDGDGNLRCAECGRPDYYVTDGITRSGINAYLRHNGWECVYSDTCAPPLRTYERWTKKGYDFLLCFDWLRRLDSNGAMLIEEEQIWRAICHIADSEDIDFAEAAGKLKEVGTDE